MYFPQLHEIREWIQAEGFDGELIMGIMWILIGCLMGPCVRRGVRFLNPFRAQLGEAASLIMEFFTKPVTAGDDWDTTEVDGKRVLTRRNFGAILAGKRRDRGLIVNGANVNKSLSWYEYRRLMTEAQQIYDRVSAKKERHARQVAIDRLRAAVGTV